jgi:hypothetical protein
MTARADLPPITRKLNADLIATQRRNSVDAETATAIGSLGAIVLCAVAELENDLIISAAASHTQPGTSRHD